MSEKEVHPRQPLNVAKRIIFSMIAGGVVTGVVVKTTIGIMNRKLGGIEPLHTAVIALIVRDPFEDQAV